MDSRLIRATVVLLFTALVLGAQPGPLYGPAGISPQAVRQGGLGSCYFHASIAAIAATYPDLLLGRLTQTGPEQYIVKFNQGRPETVQAVDVDFARRNKYDVSQGLWVAVLLRGYAQRQLRGALIESFVQTGVPGAQVLAAAAFENNDLVLVAYDRAIRSAINQNGSIDPSALHSALDRELAAMHVNPVMRLQALGFLEQRGFLEGVEQRISEDSELFGAYRMVGNGGNPARVLSNFAIARATTLKPDDHPKVLEVLRAVHQKRMAGVLGTVPQPPANAPDWFVPGHAYTILDFDEGGGRVMIRNPWGTKPSPDGDFFLPLSQISSTFWDIVQASPVR